jgi:PAS domain S-box-containing protein
VLLLSLILLSLRPIAPDWVSIVSANAVAAMASILYLEGAREFRGLPPRDWRVYGSGVVVISGLAFFLYVIPNLNARAVVMSAFVGVILLLAAVTLLRDNAPPPTFGLRLIVGLFALSGATYIARSVYSAFGPPLTDVFVLSGVHGVFFVGIAVEVSLFSIGFMLLADERVIRELQEAEKQVSKAHEAAVQEREAAALMRESERQMRTLASAAPVMIRMFGPDKICTYLNGKWLEFVGQSLENELGNGWTKGVHPDDLAKWFETFTKAFDQRGPFRLEYRLRRRDGEYRWLLKEGLPRFKTDGSFAGYITSAVDVTDHKRAEEALSSMSQKLIEAHETERARLARELHDDISQRVAALAMQLSSVAHIEPGREAGGGIPTQELAEQAVELARDLQSLSRHLHSSRFELQGLTLAAKGLCRELSERQNVKVSFSHDGSRGSAEGHRALSVPGVAGSRDQFGQAQRRTTRPRVAHTWS